MADDHSADDESGGGERLSQLRYKGAASLTRSRFGPDLAQVPTWVTSADQAEQMRRWQKLVEARRKLGHEKTMADERELWELTANLLDGFEEQIRKLEEAHQAQRGAADVLQFLHVTVRDGLLGARPWAWENENLPEVYRVRTNSHDERQKRAKGFAVAYKRCVAERLIIDADSEEFLTAVAGVTRQTINRWVRELDAEAQYDILRARLRRVVRKDPAVEYVKRRVVQDLVVAAFQDAGQRKG